MRDTIFSRYGLIGANGIGKTTLLKHIAAFEIEGFPRHHRVLHVKQEVRSSGKTVLETVLQSDVEREALMEEEKDILKRQQQKDQEGGGGASSGRKGAQVDVFLPFFPVPFLFLTRDGCRARIYVCTVHAIEIYVYTMQ
jgi:recombinational DNA repair ATPase RecF